MAQKRYIGNPNTKEFHSVARLKEACNISGDSNQQARYKRFSTQKEAHDAGYDACAKGCVKKYKSRR